MNGEQTLPGLESAIAEMEARAITDQEVDALPTFTGERVAVYEPERYALATRLLFSENISRRTICKWLHMSPNTLAAIEAREIKLHPESIEALQREARAEIEQLKRMGREALRARFFDKKRLEDTSLKELASTLKLLDDMSVAHRVPEPNRNTEKTEDNEYIDVLESDGFGREKISAPQSGYELAAPGERPEGGESGGESGGKDGQSRETIGKEVASSEG